MTLARTRKLLVMLLCATWLPATITCQPVDLNGVVRVVADPCCDEVVVVDDYDTVYWDDGGYDLYVDVYDDHHHDDDDD
jgi:hypothetical protein